MNLTNVNDISIIKTYLEQLCLEYTTQMGRFETPSTLIGPLQTHIGKKKAIWGIMRSTLRSGSSSYGRSSHVINELMVHLQMGPVEVPNDDNDFDLLASWKACESKFSVVKPHLLWTLTLISRD